MSKQIIGNKIHEEALLALVELYGRGRWSEVARALKIYDIHLPRAIDLHGIWRQLVSPGEISVEECNKLLKYGIEARGRPWKFIISWSKEFGDNRRTDQLPGLFNRRVRKGLLQLSLIFSQKRIEDRRFLSRLQYVSIKNFLKTRDIVSEDSLIQEVVASSILISDLLIAFSDHQEDNRPTQYQKFAGITKRHQFVRAIEHLKYIDALSNWSQFFGLYNEAKDNISSEYIHNPLENIKKVVPGSFRQVKNKRLKTVRGRITLEDKQLYRSCYANTFEKEMLAVMKDKKDKIKNVMIDNQIIKIQSRKEKEEQRLTEKINKDPKMREYIEKRIKQAEEQAFEQYRFCVDN